MFVSFPALNQQPRFPLNWIFGCLASVLWPVFFTRWHQCVLWLLLMSGCAAEIYFSHFLVLSAVLYSILFPCFLLMNIFCKFMKRSTRQDLQWPVMIRASLLWIVGIIPCAALVLSATEVKLVQVRWSTDLYILWLDVSLANHATADDVTVKEWLIIAVNTMYIFLLDIPPQNI